MVHDVIDAIRRCDVDCGVFSIESTKTMSMEDDSTGVLENIKNI